MTDAKPKPFLSLACGSSLFVELPQETAATYLSEKLFALSTAWTQAHAAHHQEPKK